MFDGELREHVLEGRRRQQRPRALDGIVGNDPAAMQDDDMRADAFDGVEFVRAEEHDPAACGEFLNQAAQDECGADVEAGERLVEQQQFWIVQERSGKQYFLTHALRVRRDRDVTVFVERQQLKQFVDPVRGVPIRQVTQLSHHHEVFEPGEVPVQVRLLGHVSKATLPTEYVAVQCRAVEGDFT